MFWQKESIGTQHALHCSLLSGRGGGGAHMSYSLFSSFFSVLRRRLWGWKEHWLTTSGAYLGGLKPAPRRKWKKTILGLILNVKIRTTTRSCRNRKRAFHFYSSGVRRRHCGAAGVGIGPPLLLALLQRQRCSCRRCW